MTTQTKHWIMSSVQTFLSGFVLALLPNLSTIDWQHVDKAALWALALTAIRAGIKALGTSLVPGPTAVQQ